MINGVPISSAIKGLGVIFLAGMFYATINLQVSAVKAQTEANAVQNETDKRTAMKVEYHEQKLERVDEQLDRIEGGISDLKDMVIRLDERQNEHP